MSRTLDELVDAKAIRWLFELSTARRKPDLGEIATWFTEEYQWGDGMVDALTRMGTMLDPVPPYDATGGLLRVRFGAAGQQRPRFRLILGVDESGERVSHFDWAILELEGVDLDSISCADLSASQRAELHDLFDATYEDASHAYLDESLARLKSVAMAHAGGRIVGFGISESRVVDLPAIGDSLVSLLGLACIDPEFRRQGLAGRLETLAMSNTDEIPLMPRRMPATRAAHPATFRLFRDSPHSVPQRGRQPSDLHREVGAVVADLLGADFDAERF